MILGCANIKNYPDMSRKKVIADAEKMAAVCDMWAMQENNPTEDDDVISPALGQEWGKVGGGTNLPIFFRRSKFDCAGFRIVFLGWAADELMLVAKPRLLVIAKFALKNRPGVPMFSVQNNHLIAGGKNGPQEDRRAVQWEWEWNRTQDAYDKEHAKTTGKAVVAMHGKGHVELNSDHDGLWVDVSLEPGNPTGRRTVFFLGDLNNPTPPQLARNFEWLVGERIDRIGVSKTGSGPK